VTGHLTVAMKIMEAVSWLVIVAVCVAAAVVGFICTARPRDPR
jgi:hypothetical protein